jgi:uncharacterized lipoprotein YddW (UPF0748 family)
MKYTKIIIILLPILVLFTFCKRPKIKYDETKEARGIWVTRWEWAQDKTKNNPRAQKKRIIEIFDLIKKARLNFVLFQIRGNGDAFYKSNYEPWSDLLTGKLGKDPGWDPLEFAIEQAHIRGLELHTWINTFPAWRGTNPPHHTSPEHIYNAHPEWIVCDSTGQPMPLTSHYVNLSPGIPAAREYVHNVCNDIIRNYDIDGFHFDYIRYPEKSPELGYSQDIVSMRLFNSPDGNPNNLKWEDWQRENINKFVRKFYDEATSLKPWLKISAAVIGKYDYSIWNGYHIVYQDALQWLKEKKIDFITPMIYWQTDHPTAPFGKITKNWLKNYYRSRYIFPGMSINKLGAPNWNVDEVLKQTALTRQYGSCGMVFFSFSGLEKAMTQFPNDGFQYLSNLPPMSWKDNQPPLDPTNLTAQFLTSGEVKLEWMLPDSALESTDIFRYNVFRSEVSPVDITKAINLIHITNNSVPNFIDNSFESNRNYFYVVTALDRVNNQSPPSNEVKVTLPALVQSDKNVINHFLNE